MDLIRPQFTNADVLRVLPDLHPDVFQDLINRRLIQPESERNPGSGKRRMYSAENVLQIGLVAALMDAGIKPAEAVFICGRVILQEVRQTGSLPFSAIVRFMSARVDGEVHYQMLMADYVNSEGKSQTLSAILRNLEKVGRAAIVLPTQVIEKATMTRLEEILREREEEQKAGGN